MKSKSGMTTSRSLPGAQTVGRKLQQQFNLRGGLANGTDISTADPKEWLSATNAKMPFLGSNYLGGVINTSTPQGMFYSNTYTPGDNSYTCVPSETCVATLESSNWPNDVIVFSGSGTGSIQNESADNFMNTYPRFTVPASSTTNADITTALKVLGHSTLPIISSPGLRANQTILALTVRVQSGLSNFGSGRIRIGSDSSNYYEWQINSINTANTTLKFLFSAGVKTGTPVLRAITYVQISFTANGGGQFVVDCSNLRVGAFASASLSDNTYITNNSNILKTFPYVSDSQNTQLIIYTSNFLYIQQFSTFCGPSDSRLIVQPLASGFAQEALTGTLNFQFQSFQKSGSANQNILYYVNANDGIFSFDINASAGSKLTQISSTAYRYLVSHKNYMWYAGDPANPNTIVPSILSTPGTLDLANAITLDNQDGDNIITGLVSMDDYLIIFRTKDIWVMFGSTTGVSGDILVKKTLSTTGGIGQNAITRYADKVFYFNGHGLYEFNGSSSVPISEKINFSINGIPCYKQSVTVFYNSKEECIYVSCTDLNPTIITNDPYPSANYVNCGTFIYNIFLKSFQFIGGVNDSTSLNFGGFTFYPLALFPDDGTSYGQSSLGGPEFYSYGVNIYSQITAVTFAYSQPSTWDQKFLVQSNWNNLGSPFIQKDPDQVRVFITAANSSLTANQYSRDQYGRFIIDQNGNFITTNGNPSVVGVLNFRTDFNPAVIYSAPFSVPLAQLSNGYVDLQTGPGCQGHAFSVEIDVLNNSDFPSGTIVYSGYAISWTEAEVI